MYNEDEETEEVFKMGADDDEMDEPLDMPNDIDLSEEDPDHDS
jgi:hypothetical protein